MRINNNIMALNTHRQLGINNNMTAKSLEKLSSGYRINRAGDDAAGLAISEKMRGQIRGLNMASKNAQDGISLIQTAEGGLNETHAILQRMRELAVQSANDTNNDADRGEIQKEIEQLKAEIDRISETTEFNTKKLLNGDVGQAINVVEDGSTASNILAARATDGSLDGTYALEIVSVTNGIENFKSASGVSKDNVTFAENLQTGGAAANLKAGKYTIELSGDTGSATAVLKDADGKVLTSASGDSANALELNLDGTNSVLSIEGGTYNGTAGTIEFEVGISADIKMTDPNGIEKTYTGVKANNSSVMQVGGFELDVKTNLQETGKATLNVSNKGLKFHIGANEGQNTKLAISKIDTATLNIADVDVTTQSGADAAITSINKAIENVSAERAKLGANQNRLEHTIKNLDTSAENLQAAESRIRDVDMAKEMMEFTKQNILQQAATAMLAQANMAPQSVLKLLG